MQSSSATSSYKSGRLLLKIGRGILQGNPIKAPIPAEKIASLLTTLLFTTVSVFTDEFL